MSRDHNLNGRFGLIAFSASLYKANEISHSVGNIIAKSLGLFFYKFGYFIFKSRGAVYFAELFNKFNSAILTHFLNSFAISSEQMKSFIRSDILCASSRQIISL